MIYFCLTVVEKFSGAGGEVDGSKPSPANCWGLDGLGFCSEGWMARGASGDEYANLVVGFPIAASRSRYHISFHRSYWKKDIRCKKIDWAPLFYNLEYIYLMYMAVTSFSNQQLSI